MNLSTPVKVLALVVFLAALAGATYGVQQVLGDGVEGRLVTAQPGRTTLSATPGHTVTYVVTLTNRDSDERQVAAVVSGAGIEGRAPLVRLAAAGNGTAFVPVRVPDGLAPGDYPLALRVVDEANQTLRERADAFTLRVLPPGGRALAAGEVGQVVFTGRIAESGRVFASNDQALRGLNLLRTDTFQLGGAPVNVSTAGSPVLPRGAVEALVGMKEGETRTVSLTPEQGFGNATFEERVDRTFELERRETLDLPSRRISLAALEAHLNETGQGDVSEFEVGDIVLNEDGGQVLRFRIENLTEQGADLRLTVQVGERYTVYEFWPNGSEVREVTETTAVFYTTPTTGEDERFTFLAYWPEMTSVAAVDEDTITLRHDPSVGLKYSRTVSQFQPPRQYTVVSVDADEIVVSTPSSEPLAGRELTYDLTLLAIRG